MMFLKYIFLFIVFLNIFSFAVNKTWNATGNSNFSIAENWNPSGIPGVSDIAIHDNTSVYNDSVKANISVGSFFTRSNYSGVMRANGQTITVIDSAVFEGSGAHDFGLGLTVNGNNGYIKFASTLGAVTTTYMVVTIGGSGINWQHDKAFSQFPGITLNASKSLTITGSANLQFKYGTTRFIGFGNSSSLTLNNNTTTFNSDGNIALFTFGTGCTFNGTGNIFIKPAADAITISIPATTYTGSGTWQAIDVSTFGETINLTGKMNLGTAKFQVVGTTASKMYFKTNGNGFKCGQFDYGANNASGVCKVTLGAENDTVTRWNALYTNGKDSIVTTTTNIACYGDWKTSGYLDRGTSKISFIGDTQSTVTTGNLLYYDVEVIKTSSAKVTLADSLKVRNLTIYSGKFDPNGKIITCNHFIDSASGYDTTFMNGMVKVDSNVTFKAATNSKQVTGYFNLITNNHTFTSAGASVGSVCMNSDGNSLTLADNFLSVGTLYDSAGTINQNKKTLRAANLVVNVLNNIFDSTVTVDTLGIISKDVTFQRASSFRRMIVGDSVTVAFGAGYLSSITTYTNGDLEGTSSKPVLIQSSIDDVQDTLSMPTDTITYVSIKDTKFKNTMWLDSLGITRGNNTNLKSISTYPDSVFISPIFGPTGTIITIRVKNGLIGGGASIGGTAVTGWTVVNKTTATATVSDGPDGVKDLKIWNSDGDTVIKVNAFSQGLILPDIDSIGPTAVLDEGGTNVRIRGINFTTKIGPSALYIGTTPLTHTYWDDTLITFTSPVSTQQLTYIKITNSYGNNDSIAFRIYTTPIIYSNKDTSGNMIGGYLDTIDGNGFEDIRGTGTVYYGETPVSSYTSWSNTRIIVTVPTVTTHGHTDIYVNTNYTKKDTLVRGINFFGTRVWAAIGLNTNANDSGNYIPTGALYRKDDILLNNTSQNTWRLTDTLKIKGINITNTYHDTVSVNNYKLACDSFFKTYSINTYHLMNGIVSIEGNNGKFFIDSSIVDTASNQTNFYIQFQNSDIKLLGHKDTLESNYYVLNPRSLYIASPGCTTVIKGKHETWVERTVYINGGVVVQHGGSGLLSKCKPPAIKPFDVVNGSMYIGGTITFAPTSPGIYNFYAFPTYKGLFEDWSNGSQVTHIFQPGASGNYIINQIGKISTAGAVFISNRLTSPNTSITYNVGDSGIFIDYDGYLSISNRNKNSPNGVVVNFGGSVDTFGGIDNTYYTDSATSIINYDSSTIWNHSFLWYSANNIVNAGKGKMYFFGYGGGTIWNRGGSIYTGIIQNDFNRYIIMNDSFVVKHKLEINSAKFKTMGYPLSVGDSLVLNTPDSVWLYNTILRMTGENALYKNNIGSSYYFNGNSLSLQFYNNGKILSLQDTIRLKNLSVGQGKTLELQGNKVYFDSTVNATDLSGSSVTYLDTLRTTVNGEKATLWIPSSTTLYYTAVKDITAVNTITCAACYDLGGNTNILFGPYITTHPENKTVRLGRTAQFEVNVIGTPPLSYQWYKGTVLINGATESNYTTPTVTTSDNGNIYNCIISNSYGTVTSNNSVLTTRNPWITILKPNGGR